MYVDTEQGKWTINETTGRAMSPSGNILQGEVCYQSALTPILVDQILNTGQCDLPTLSESAAQHQPLLDALLAHWNNFMNSSDLTVPIT